VTRVERLIDQLERAFRGDPWHGPSVLGVLDGVTAEAAMAHPVPGAHSIWELVLHMTGWKREVLARFQGRSAGEPAAGDWPPVPGGDAAWRAALADLRGAHDDLIAALRPCDDSRLDVPVRDERNPALGTPVAQWQSLAGILQHDVYHQGQIALLKRALAA
jgi:uncharacterized damage-inducible protein DinB